MTFPRPRVTFQREYIGGTFGFSFLRTKIYKVLLL
jgi:hypothetical protein